MALTIDQIVRITAAGGGMSINAQGKTVDQVVRIAAAASNNQAKLVIRSTQNYTTDQLVRVAAAGQGCVFLTSKVNPKDLPRDLYVTRQVFATFPSLKRHVI